MSGRSRGAIVCDICPKHCRIPPGYSGECRIRLNLDGRLVASTYGRPCAVHVDPMEKKPLYHFLPAEPILSVGTAGCNLHCRNCQNYEISQGNPEEVPAYELPPEKVPELARQHGARSIAYTYTEPIVSYEYTRDCSQAARGAGMRNVMITAGYINEKPLAELLPLLDAANIDLKGMSDKFYREVCSATLTPVLRTIRMMAEAGVHLEITNLLIPNLNDSDEDFGKLCEWLLESVGAEVPLHISRFFPQHRMANIPPTPLDTLTGAQQMAQRMGLRHVYVGNAEVKDGEITCCAGCGARVISRRRYVITENRIGSDGGCPECGRKVYGVWS